MHPGLAERGSHVGLRKIKNAAVHRGVVRDREVEDAVGGGYAQAADRRGWIDRAGGIDASRAANGIDRVHDLCQRFVHVGPIAFNLRELADFQHEGRKTFGTTDAHRLTLIKPEERFRVRESYMQHSILLRVEFSYCS